MIEFNEQGQALDPEYPGVIGHGRSTKGAEADFHHRLKTTWHLRRIAGCQATLDSLLSGDLDPTEAEITELMSMLDEFVGYLRADSKIPKLDLSS